MLESERAKQSKSGVKKECPICSKEIWCYPYKLKLKKQVFCSMECSFKYRIPLMRKGHNEKMVGYKWSDEILKKRKDSLPRGSNHPGWAGDNVKYRAIHNWVESVLGKPHNCELCGNKELTHRQYHWANLSGQYLRDTEDWSRMCVKCHKSYDKDKKLFNLIEMAY